MKVVAGFLSVLLLGALGNVAKAGWGEDWIESTSPNGATFGGAQVSRVVPGASGNPLTGGSAIGGWWRTWTPNGVNDFATTPEFDMTCHNSYGQATAYAGGVCWAEGAVDLHAYVSGPSIDNYGLGPAFCVISNQ